MANKRAPHTPLTRSSGNVFADLGFQDADEELTKAQLASQIRFVIEERRITQVAAAGLMGIDQPKVSALFNGRLENFSSGRLMRFLTALGRDVSVMVTPTRGKRTRGQIRVVASGN